MQTLLLIALAGSLVAPERALSQDRCGERQPAPGLLVSADWLKLHRSDSDLVLLQVERARPRYDSAHVAGARFVGFGDFAATQNGLLTELPPVAHLDSLFESLGIGDGRGRIVLYGDLLGVTRLFFTFDYLGLGDRVSVLQGGLAAWQGAGGTVTTEATAPASRGLLTLVPDPDVLADAAWVESHRTDPKVQLLDARTREEFEGTRAEEGLPRLGHIPGAASLDWTTTVADGRFKQGAELRQLFTGAGATAGKEVVTYCRVGTRASALYFAARLLGMKVRLYDGSMNEWSARADLPITGPKPPD